MGTGFAETPGWNATQRRIPRMTAHHRRAYLAGGIEFAEEAASNWRREMTAWLHDHLGHAALDPTIHDDDQLTPGERASFRQWKADGDERFLPAIRKIIHHDLRTILEASDYVICRWCEGTQRGGGTAGELTLAYWHQVPVYLVLDRPRAEMSAWILGCATHVYPSLDALREDLLRIYGSGDAAR
jgi:hypothetical protein